MKFTGRQRRRTTESESIAIIVIAVETSTLILFVLFLIFTLFRIDVLEVCVHVGILHVLIILRTHYRINFHALLVDVKPYWLVEQAIGRLIRLLVIVKLGTVKVCRSHLLETILSVLLNGGEVCILVKGRGVIVRVIIAEVWRRMRESRLRSVDFVRPFWIHFHARESIARLMIDLPKKDRLI